MAFMQIKISRKMVTTLALKNLLKETNNYISKKNEFASKVIYFKDSIYHYHHYSNNIFSNLWYWKCQKKRG